MMEGAIQFASLLLAVFAVLVMLGNWWQVADWLLFGRTHSTVPLVGGIAGAVAIAISPFPELHRFWWLPLVADIGCFTMVIAGCLRLITFGGKRLLGR